MAFLSSLFTPVSSIPSYDTNVSSNIRFSNFLQVKSARGNLFTVTGFTSAGVCQYLQIYNSSSYPPVGTPLSVSVIPEFSNFNINFNNGLPCTSGILLVVSTTPSTLNPSSSSTYITAIFR